LSGEGIPLDAADDALEQYEERAAIREYDGGQDRAEAEAAALVEAARAVGVAPDALREAWRPRPRRWPATLRGRAGRMGRGQTRGGHHAPG